MKGELERYDKGNFRLSFFIVIIMFSYKKEKKPQRYAKMLNQRRQKKMSQDFKRRYKKAPQIDTGNGKIRGYILNGNFNRVYNPDFMTNQGSVIVSSVVTDPDLINEVSEKIEELSNYTYGIISIYNITYTEALSFIKGKYREEILDLYNFLDNVERGQESNRHGHIEDFMKDINARSNTITQLIKNIRHFRQITKNIYDRWGNQHDYELNYVYYSTIGKR